jgi:hypothetical protein
VALRDRRLAGLALFVALAVLHTWPLATAPGTLCRHDNADAQLNAWILAWVPHALVTQPFHLFDANIFHPDRHTLAYSEHMFVQGVMGAPLTWMGASPVLVMNLLIIAGMALTGWATSLVLHRWTGDWPAAILGGALAAFNTHLLTRMGHAQAMHVEFLPFVLLALDDLLRDPRPREGLRLAVWFALQSLCSVYLMAMTVITVVAAALARAGEWLTRDRLVRFTKAALLAAVVAGLLCLPFLWPYARVRAEQGAVRPMDEVAMYSADWRNYLSTASRLHYTLWSHRFFQYSDTLFPGVLALAFTLVSVFTGIAWRDRRARMLTAAGIAGVALSFGAKLPGYAALHAVFPLLQGTRAASRFGYIGMFAVAGLAAFGLARLRAGRSPRARLAIAGIALLLVTAESLRAPLAFVRYQGIPQVYDTLRTETGAVVAEFPWYSPRYFEKNAPYVLASTRHWKPIVNGYSGLVPPSYGRHNEGFRLFPEDAGFAALRAAGVTHVVVHVDQLPAVIEVLQERTDIEPFAQSRDIRIYRIRQE